jgi:hypothetical protein
MLAYATIGTNDFAKSAVFFDVVLGTLNLKRTHDMSDYGWMGNKFSAVCYGPA